MATRKQFEDRLDRMIEAAKGSERPYKTLEGKPWSLSPGIARTIVVGSGLSKSAPEVREREAKRIARWREHGGFAPAKAKPTAAKPKTAKQKAGPKAEEPGPSVEIPEAAAAGVDAAYAEAEKTRKRAPRKTGEGSAVAKAIAANRGPVAPA
jgi:hypothetical protein